MLRHADWLSFGGRPTCCARSTFERSPSRGRDLPGILRPSIDSNDLSQVHISNVLSETKARLECWGNQAECSTGTVANAAATISPRDARN